MQFNNQSFHKRFQTMGDLAEGKTEEYLKQNNIDILQFGFNRPNYPFHLIPDFLKSMPDFLINDNGKSVFLEVKGFGKDRTIKIKNHDLNMLTEWNKIAPVYFCFYDSQRKNLMYKYSLERIKGITLVSDYSFYRDNNKKYFKINYKKLS